MYGSSVASCHSTVRNRIKQAKHLTQEVNSNKSADILTDMQTTHHKKETEEKLLRAISVDGRYRILCVDSTKVVQEICTLQDCDPTASVALGRLITGTLLMGGLLKGDQRLALQVEGNGPIRKMHTETDVRGRIRATLHNPHPGTPLKDGRIDVASAVGKAGFLSVIKDLGLKDPYKGMVQLQSSEIGEDLSWYLTTSEQVPSAVALSVQVSAEGIDTAGGYLFQALPPGDENSIAEIETHLHTLPPVSRMLSEGLAIEDILQKIFARIPYKIKSSITPRFVCNCNLKQVAGILKSMGQAELRSIIEEQGKIEITCEYCRKTYSFGEEILTESNT